LHRNVSWNENNEMEMTPTRLDVAPQRLNRGVWRAGRAHRVRAAPLRPGDVAVQRLYLPTAYEPHNVTPAVETLHRNVSWNENYETKMASAIQTLRCNV
jgi:hypothetical protein